MTAQLETLGAVRRHPGLAGGTTAHPKIDPQTGTIVKMFGGCETCGYVSYYGRFVPRSDLRGPLDLLMVGFGAIRTAPIRQEESVALNVLVAR